MTENLVYLRKIALYTIGSDYFREKIKSFFINV